MGSPGYAHFRRGVLAFILVGFITTLLAQENPFASQHSKDTLPLSQQASAIPLSNTLITLNITLENGKSIKATQLEGGLIRVEFNEFSIFGLFPYVSNPASRDVAVKIFRISKVSQEDKAIGERLSELETLSVSLDSASAVVKVPDTSSRFFIQLLAVKKDAGSIGKVVTLLGNGDIDPHLISHCCVSCDGGPKTCACAVESDCGNCCMGACCN